MCCVGKLELIDKCVYIFKPVESDVTAVVGIFLKGRLGSPFFSSSDVHLKCQESAKGTQTFWNDVFIWFLSLSSILMKDTHCDITVYLLFCIPICFTWANNSVSSLSFSLISLIFFFYSVHLILLSFWILSCVISIPPWPNTQNHLCSVAEVLDGNRGRVYGTVGVLLSMAPPLISPSPQVQLAGFALFYLSIMSVLCAIYVHLALRIWTHTLHETPDSRHVIRQIHSNRELKILCCSLKKTQHSKISQNTKHKVGIQYILFRTISSENHQFPATNQSPCGDGSSLSEVVYVLLCCQERDVTCL